VKYPLVEGSKASLPGDVWTTGLAVDSWRIMEVTGHQTFLVRILKNCRRAFGRGWRSNAVHMVCLQSWRFLLVLIREALDECNLRGIVHVVTGRDLRLSSPVVPRPK
jgi:hypothetical protein